MTSSDLILGLPAYQITGLERRGPEVRISIRYTGPISCPHCGGEKLRNKDRFTRRIRHESLCGRRCVLLLDGRKYRCLGCGRYFRQRFPGILQYQRSSEAYQKRIFMLHLDGINRSQLGRREGMGAATVARYFQRQIERKLCERNSEPCPRVLGIDEHFFSRKKGFATTFCDLSKHKIHDVTLGRSQISLEGYLQALKGKDRVRVICMDLSVTYRSIAKRYFPNASIVADRFHVIRLINHHFLACWRELDPEASRNRGLLSLMRRHQCNLKPEQKPRLLAYLDQQPALKLIYRFKQFLCNLLMKKTCNKRTCARLAPRLLRAIEELRQAGLPQLVQLGETLYSWRDEIARMWRFSRSNGITEGFHNKMENISRAAYGFRNFKNYSMRVRMLCS